jgi:glucosamine--fructose-6-phosphate aminotransferase (isomerizing)
MVDKGNFRHFMAKEIHEQPTVLAYTLGGFLRAEEEGIILPPLSFDPAALPKITLIGCGTAYYAGCVAKYWFEQIARIPTETDIASEFRYRDPVLAPGGLALFISQSGETADTLAALRYARAHGQHVAAIVNVAESTIAREARERFLTHAGPEIGVASTKAFTCQLMVLAALAIAFARARGAISAEEEQRLTHALIEVPRLVADILHHEADLHALAQELAKARDVLYLGRGNCYPIALEGALKLKEISYIHAEGYAAGEMKHGPIALIDEAMPLVVLAPSNGMFEKTASNMQEAVTRGGRAVLVSDRHGIRELGERAWASFEMPKADPFVAPLLYAVPMQLLAYHTAVLKGTDVDQPRNLAKSVTVE